MKNKPKKSSIKQIVINEKNTDTINITDWNSIIKYCLIVFCSSRVVIWLAIYFCMWVSHEDISLVDLLTTKWDSVYFIKIAKINEFHGAFFHSIQF